MPESQDDKPTSTQREFFRKAVRGHDKVSGLDSIDDQIYRIDRAGDLDEVFVYITNLYTLGCGDIIEIRSKCRKLNCIVTMSNWNEYTGDAKRYAREQKIGIFKFAEFMGALNFRQPWKYEKKDRDYGPDTRYKSS